MKESRSPDSRLVFQIRCIDEQTTLLNGGTSTAVSYYNGVATFVAASLSKIVFTKTFASVKTLRIKFKPSSTTQNIVKLTSSHSVSASSGTLSATGFSSPTIYNNGSVSSTITTGWNEVVITTATAITVNALTIGYISSYYSGDIDLVEGYNAVLTSNEVSNLYSNRSNVPFIPHGEILGAEMVLPTWGAGAGNPTINGQIISFKNEASSVRATLFWDITKYYKVTCIVTNYSGTGNIILPYDGTTSGRTITANGTYSYYYSPKASTTIYISSFIGHTATVTVNSIREVISCATPILSVDAFNGVIVNRANSTAITNTNVSVVRSGASWGMAYNGSTSLLSCGTAAFTDVTFVCFATFYGWGESNAGRLVDNGKFKVYISSTNNRVAVTSDGSTTVYSATNSIVIGTPYMIAVTRKADGKASVYLATRNSAVALSGSTDQASGTPATGTTAITFGNDSTGAYTMNGVSKQWMLTGGILSLAELTQIWSSNKHLL